MSFKRPGKSAAVSAPTPIMLEPDEAAVIFAADGDHHIYLPTACETPNVALATAIMLRSNDPEWVREMLQWLVDQPDYPKEAA